ncbi:hypothetical protein PUR61_02480 [Streptomyces sp. BE20]|uniref:hypothetical protein n=1 Tax=Streptomyces sp. BE20 TaxID=3002525 RepID=UPI002E787630|nr:hypothetical protein [Streptomyces sp. BE20]MEE1821072.1 hypothetical protein [Streptomyces sp. BE20]
MSGRSTGADAQRCLIWAEGGFLADSLTGRRVSLAELADEVRSGCRFRVWDGASGGERTYQVLIQVLLSALASAPVAGVLPGTAGLVSLIGRAGPLDWPNNVEPRTRGG